MLLITINIHQDKYAITINILLDDDLQADLVEDTIISRSSIGIQQHAVSCNHGNKTTQINGSSASNGEHSDGSVFSIIFDSLISAFGNAETNRRSVRFEGGGTMFWQQPDEEGSTMKSTMTTADYVAAVLLRHADYKECCFDPGARCSEPCHHRILLQPKQGTAVLFNGEIVHAGREVTSGVRHLYVASFTLGGGGGA